MISVVNITHSLAGELLRLKYDAKTQYETIDHLIISISQSPGRSDFVSESVWLSTENADNDKMVEETIGIKER